VTLSAIVKATFAKLSSNALRFKVKNAIVEKGKEAKKYIGDLVLIL
jgi:hypothetical protein